MYYREKREKEKERHRKTDYSREHDFPVYPASFLISPRFLTIFSHACQVTLSPILQVMNNSLNRTRDKLLSKKWHDNFTLVTLFFSF